MTTQATSPATNTDEVGADGPVGLATTAVTAATRPSNPHNPSTVGAMLAAIPAEPFGFPIVFWIGSVLFLVILALIFGPSLLALI